MRTTVFALSALLFAATLTAQQTPDYSRPTLLRILADQPEQQERKVEYPFGAIQIDGRTTRWLIGYLPLLAPLSMLGWRSESGPIFTRCRAPGLRRRGSTRKWRIR